MVLLSDATDETLVATRTLPTQDTGARGQVLLKQSTHSSPTREMDGDVPQPQLAPATAQRQPPPALAQPLLLCAVPASVSK